jgi:hypothetical protein
MCRSLPILSSRRIRRTSIAPCFEKPEARPRSGRCNRISGGPARLPFTWDAGRVSKGLNFTLTTSAGDLDLLGEITCGATYEALLPDTIVIAAFGIECRCLSLDRLIVKRAAGRVKDFEAIAELEALGVERGAG